jgi:hypothetical protein
MDNKRKVLQSIKDDASVRAQVRRQYQEVLTAVPERSKNMAMILLGQGMLSASEIIEACRVGTGNPGSSPGQQNLYQQGAEQAAELLGKVASIPHFDIPVPSNLVLDERLFAAGEAAAKVLKPLLLGSGDRKIA